MNQIRGLDAWLLALNEQELPTLNSVVSEICELSAKQKTRADELTDIILRDVNLTAKVLKIANSVHYNASFMPIKTVSRGIVQLGFENLKNITLAAALIDTFLQGKPKQLMVHSLARSFHAAVQAKAMVAHLNAEHKEQVFIAALLRNLSELALIATGKSEAENYIIEKNKDPIAEHKLAQHYFGVDTTLLTRNLIKDWALGDLAMEACDDFANMSTAARAVNLGNELSKYIHKGPSSAEMQKIYEQMASLCKISAHDAKKQVMMMADEASVVAKSYGVDVLLSALPDMQELEKLEQAQSIAIQSEIDEGINKEAVHNTEAEFIFQQRLHQIQKAMMSGENLSIVMQLSVATLHEASVVKRAAIAMVDYKTKSLDIAYVAGKGTLAWRKEVAISLENLRKGELLHDFLRTQEPIWHKAKSMKDMGKLSIFNATGDIFLAPLVLNKRIMAVIYGDAVDGELNPRQFEEFQLIANQLSLMMRINAAA
jgi:HD-like signal output (HDOD) protein